VNGPGLRIEEAVGGRVKKGRTKMQVEMIVGTEKIRGVEVSAHTGTCTGNCDSLIIIDYQAKMTLIITIT